MKKQYRVCKVVYNEKADAFETWIAVTEGRRPSDEDFGMELSARCVNSAKYPDAEASYIHYELLKRIARAAALGYEIDWRI